jgi:hypothetical protein
MVDETPLMIAEGDLRRLYAKINAHQCIIRAVVNTLADMVDNPNELMESLRANAMEDADSLVRKTGSENVDFIDEGRLETLSFVADFFSTTKQQRAGDLG